MKTISVIVPVYNVEKYIHRCIDSIINQTYKNLEIILVDDGSTDNCPKICDEYAQKDNRIKVIHKKNGGLSEARNVGIEIATGEYIGFIDSDDYINKKMYELLISGLETNDADICICNYKEVNNDYIINDEKQDSYNFLKFNNIEALEALYKENGVKFVIACNKLYNKNLFADVRYSIGKIHEDEYIIHKLFFNSKRVVYLDKELYYYYQRQDSITKKQISPKRLDALDALKERGSFFEINNLTSLKESNEKMMFYCCLKQYVDFRDIKNSLVCNRLKKRLRELYKLLRKHKDLNIIEKVKYMIGCYIPEIYFVKFKLR